MCIMNTSNLVKKADYNTKNAWNWKENASS